MRSPAGGAARMFFAFGSAHLIDAISEVPAEVVRVDWRTDLAVVRTRLPGRALQGSLDPARLFADRETLSTAVTRVLHAGLGGPHIFNLGHGIWRSTPIDAVSRLIETAHGFQQT